MNTNINESEEASKTASAVVATTAEAETESESELSSCKYRLTGIVQNVGFRHHLQQAAKHCAVRGWAKNESDGSLIVYIHGDKNGVSDFVRHLQGPNGAQVNNMCELLIEKDDDCPADFEIR